MLSRSLCREADSQVTVALMSSDLGPKPHETENWIKTTYRKSDLLVTNFSIYIVLWKILFTIILVPERFCRAPINKVWKFYETYLVSQDCH